MTPMKEGNDYGSIPISTAKTLVKLDEFKVAGLDIEFYYLDDGVKSSMQWVLKNFEDSDYYDGTQDSIVKLNYVALKYLTNEGVIDMWNLFINNPKAQKWMMTRKSGGYRKPRQSTVNQLLKLYDWYKNKYTTIKL